MKRPKLDSHPHWKQNKKEPPKGEQLAASEKSRKPATPIQPPLRMCPLRSPSRGPVGNPITSATSSCKLRLDDCRIRRRIDRFASRRPPPFALFTVSRGAFRSVNSRFREEMDLFRAGEWARVRFP